MRTHLITNFPPNYPLYKKISANFIYFFTGLSITPRHNLLSSNDLIKSRLHLRRGDIVLVGDLRQILASMIGGCFTHATMYVGRKLFIEAAGNGVKYSTLNHIFTKYDTLAILRLPKHTSHKHKIIKNTIKYAQQQVGKAYDYDFSKTKQGFFCSKLVNESYRSAGYKTRLASTSQPRSWISKIITMFTRAHTALRPTRFPYGNFDVVFLSHNLIRKGKKILLNDKKAISKNL